MNEEVTQPILTEPVTTETKTEPTPSLISEAAKTVEAPVVEPLKVEDFKDVAGFDAADPHLKSYVDTMNDQALSPKERATKLLELQKAVVDGLSEKGNQAFMKMNEDWAAQTRADPEFANGKLEPALGGISKLVNRFGGPETREAFDLTGAGNHPAIIKFLHKMSAILNEPGPDPQKVIPPVAPKDRASVMFPNQG